MNPEIPDVPDRFWNGRKTKDQIANIRWILEKAREFQENIFFCFLDFTKVFDCVDYNKLWKILREMGVLDHFTCLLRNMNEDKEATIRKRHEATDWVMSRKEYDSAVCCFPVCLTYTLSASWEMPGWIQAGIKKGGRNINNLRYVDDATLMAGSEEELKSLLMKVKGESERAGLKLNIKKLRLLHLTPLLHGK